MPQGTGGHAPPIRRCYQVCTPGPLTGTDWSGCSFGGGPAGLLLRGRGCRTPYWDKANRSRQGRRRLSHGGAVPVDSSGAFRLSVQPHRHSSLTNTGCEYPLPRRGKQLSQNRGHAGRPVLGVAKATRPCSSDTVESSVVRNSNPHQVA